MTEYECREHDIRRSSWKVNHNCSIFGRRLRMSDPFIVQHISVLSLDRYKSRLTFWVNAPHSSHFFSRSIYLGIYQQSWALLGHWLLWVVYFRFGPTGHDPSMSMWQTASNYPNRWFLFLRSEINRPIKEAEKLTPLKLTGNGRA